MRKKLQTYQGVIAYKADKTPVKRVFYGRSKAEAKAKYFAYIAEHGQAEKMFRPVHGVGLGRAVAASVQAALHHRSGI